MAFTMSPILSMTAAALFASVILGYAVKTGDEFSDRMMHCINLYYLCHKKSRGFRLGIFYGVDNGSDSKGR